MLSHRSAMVISSAFFSADDAVPMPTRYPGSGANEIVGILLVDDPRRPLQKAAVDAFEPHVGRFQHVRIR
jgi:hypothetical protein